MSRTFAIALAAATLISASAVSAQTVDLGPGGPSIDLRSDRARDRDFRRTERDRERDMDRRAAYRDRDRDLSTGSVGRCKEVTIRERDEYGNVETRRRRDCN